MSHFLGSMSVSTEQYCSRMDGGIYESYKDVPGIYREVLEKGEDGEGTYDYMGMLERGKAWITQPLERLQPHSYGAFQAVVGPLLLGIVLIKDLLRPGGPPLVQPVLFFDASDRMIEVKATFPGDTYECGNFPKSLLSLPDDLAKSWLWRTKGWRVPSEPFQGPMINRRLIGHPMGGWLSLDGVLESYDRRRQKVLMSHMLERFPDAVVTLHNPHDASPYQWTSMRCFLDTRPADLGGPVGDQFFVFDQKRDQTVYHIHQGDIDDIRILRDPADAIDRYCAHVLRGLSGEFDFSPWSEPLAI